MPLERLVLILLVVLVAAGATIWLAAIAIASFTLPVGALALLPTALVAYVAVRIVSDRLRNRDDDHYDRMK